MLRILLSIAGVCLALLILWLLGSAFIDNGGWKGLIRSVSYSDYSTIADNTLDTAGQIDSLIYNDSALPLVTVAELGEFSSLRGRVLIAREKDAAQAILPSEEHLILYASEKNTQAINITGWYLESMVTGTSAVIPQGSSLFVLGEVNTPHDIYLQPGETAIITTGTSPVGVSFRANMCTGFLNIQDGFYPKLDEVCVLPSSVMPATLENIRTYGDSCIDFARNFPACRYITDAVLAEATLSTACEEKLRVALTYATCVRAYEQTPSFLSGYEWRVFLGNDTSLWKEKYEVIRLLDSDGKTVDAFVY